VKKLFCCMALALSGLCFSVQATSNLVEEIVSKYVPLARQVGDVRMKYLWFDVYDVALYASEGKFFADDSFALQLDYLRDLSGEKIAERSIKEIRLQGFNDELKLTAWLNQMKAVFPDIKKGDT
jgi:hypothetical protein